MIKLALTIAAVSAFAFSSAFAGSCGSCTGGKDKKGDKETTKESASYTINL
jgi:hypothetical protein